MKINIMKIIGWLVVLLYFTYLVFIMLAEDKLKISIIICVGAAAFAVWVYYNDKFG